METKPVYTIRLKRTFESFINANDFCHENSVNMNEFQISYHIPQPQYKSWVPNWLIRLITKL